MRPFLSSLFEILNCVNDLRKPKVCCNTHKVCSRNYFPHHLQPQIFIERSSFNCWESGGPRIFSKAFIDLVSGRHCLEWRIAFEIRPGDLLQLLQLLLWKTSYSPAAHLDVVVVFVNSRFSSKLLQRFHSCSLQKLVWHKATQLGLRQSRISSRWTAHQWGKEKNSLDSISGPFVMSQRVSVLKKKKNRLPTQCFNKNKNTIANISLPGDHQMIFFWSWH